MSTLNLDPERLTSLDDHGDRAYIHPADVRGFFRKYRDWTQALLIAFFVLLPWTNINNAQSVLLDITHRKFAIFGVTFFAHDAPLIFFLLATATLGLAFVTSIWGRVWCGWACPQTVFIDGVYRRIETWIEGNYIKRRQNEKAAMTFSVFIKKLIKWICFFAVSSAIAHSFAAYFVGSSEIIKMVLHSPHENWETFLFVTVITIVLLFDFGWFREQFCIIACPYGRFQSVLMDSKTINVLYDSNRGEPRKGLATDDRKQGDCIDCKRCVQVCPTGIDIRKGLQMECIACTSCIDACDEIMEKVKKPKGLIRYSSIENNKVDLTKPRSLIYLSLIFVCLSGLSYFVITREPLQIFVLRGKDTPYQVVKNPAGQMQILNHFKLHVKNQTFRPANYFISTGADQISKSLSMTIAKNPFVVGSGEDENVHVFVEFDPALVEGTGQALVKIRIEDKVNPTQGYFQEKDLSLVGPP